MLKCFCILKCNNALYFSPRITLILYYYNTACFQTHYQCYLVFDWMFQGRQSVFPGSDASALTAAQILADILRLICSIVPLLI